MDHFRGRFVDIAPDVQCGEDCEVWSFAIICAGVRMGHRCVIGSHVYVGRGVVLGDDVRIQHGAFIPNGTRIGHRVFIGPNATFTDDRYPRVNNPQYHAEPPVLEDDVSVGAAAVLLPGVTLGHGCVIGAGAVVTHAVLPFATWVGHPARARRSDHARAAANTTGHGQL